MAASHERPPASHGRTAGLQEAASTGAPPAQARLPRSSCTHGGHVRMGRLFFHHRRGLPNLIFLDLYNNAIEQISGLSPVPTLRVLMLGKNRLSRIEGLEALPKLDVLDLHCNRIRTIEGLSHLAELVRLCRLCRRCRRCRRCRLCRL